MYEQERMQGRLIVCQLIIVNFTLGTCRWVGDLKAHGVCIKPYLAERRRGASTLGEGPKRI